MCHIHGDYELLLQDWLKWHVNARGKCDGVGLLCIRTVQRSWFTHPAVRFAGIPKCTMKSWNSNDSGEILRLMWKHGPDTQFSFITASASEIATFQRHIKGIGALKFRCADWVYTDDLPMPPFGSVCKAEFSTSLKYVDFRSHVARPPNSFDVASSEANVVHLKTSLVLVQMLLAVSAQSREISPLPSLCPICTICLATDVRYVQ